MWAAPPGAAYAPAGRHAAVAKRAPFAAPPLPTPVQHPGHFYPVCKSWCTRVTIYMEDCRLRLSRLRLSQQHTRQHAAVQHCGTRLSHRSSTCAASSMFSMKPQIRHWYKGLQLCRDKASVCNMRASGRSGSMAAISVLACTCNPLLSTELRRASFKCTCEGEVNCDDITAWLI